MGYVARMGRGGVYTGVWYESLGEYLGIPRRRWKNNFKMGLQQARGKAWIGLKWLRI